MNAREARELTNQIRQKKIDEQYNEIKKKIESVVNKGEYYNITHYGFLYEEVRVKLVEEEFLVGETTYIQYGNETKISWS